MNFYFHSVDNIPSEHTKRREEEGKCSSFQIIYCRLCYLNEDELHHFLERENIDEMCSYLWQGTGN